MMRKEMIDLRIAVCPGSFDPVTFGHRDIIHRASMLFDKVIVLVAVNQMKSPVFTPEERVEMIKKVAKEFKNVEVDMCCGLIADYVRNAGAVAIVKGLRAVTDFEYEFQMALVNKNIYGGAETVFLTTSSENMYLSSSVVKQVAHYGGDISKFVPECILGDIEARLKPTEYRRIGENIMAEIMLEDYIDEMSEILDRAQKAPFSGKKVMVDGELLDHCIANIRMNLPSEIKNARKIVQERKTIIEDAKKQADEIITRAESRAIALTDNHEITKAAEARAMEIQKQAMAKAKAVKNAADEYIMGILGKTEAVLAESLNSVRRTKTTIKSPQTPNPNVPLNDNAMPR